MFLCPFQSFFKGIDSVFYCVSFSFQKCSLLSLTWCQDMLGFLKVGNRRVRPNPPICLFKLVWWRNPFLLFSFEVSKVFSWLFDICRSCNSIASVLLWGAISGHSEHLILSCTSHFSYGKTSLLENPIHIFLWAGLRRVSQTISQSLVSRIENATLSCMILWSLCNLWSCSFMSWQFARFYRKFGYSTH